jgi:hypothetical protein
MQINFAKIDIKIKKKGGLRAILPFDYAAYLNLSMMGQKK